jgi:hypothetical protein
MRNNPPYGKKIDLVQRFGVHAWKESIPYDLLLGHFSRLISFQDNKNYPINGTNTGAGF